MSIETLFTIIGIVSVGAGVVRSHVQHGGRLNGHDSLFVEREKLLDERYDEMKIYFQRVERKIDRIEDRMDKLSEDSRA